MNVAMVTDTYWPRISGVATSIDAFSRELRRRGHQVRVLAPAFPGAEKEADTVRFPSHYLFFDPEDRLPNPWLPSARRLAREVSSAHIDVFHTHTPFTLGIAAFAWARRCGAPVVHTYHTFFAKYAREYLPFVPGRLGEKWAASLSRKYCDRCALVITPSSSMRDVLRSYGVDTAIEVNPTGIDASALVRGEGATFRARHGLGIRDRVLLFMGRLAGEKNVRFLLRVAEILAGEFKELKLVVAGDGPARRDLVRDTAKRGLERIVRFTGYLTGGEWANCYRAADVFVFASESESQGLVLSEARAAGLPVVAVGAMGVIDIMGGRARGEVTGGTLVGPQEREFAAAVRRYLTDEEYRRGKKEEALESAAQWTPEAATERMLEIYRRAAGRPLRMSAASGGT